jgi:hypothetical protein
LRDARALVAAGAVTLTADGAVVISNGTGHHVIGTAGGTGRCTCPWWGKHRGERGPCKHVLAAGLARRT